MFMDPRAVLMLIILVGVTGWVARGLMASWYKLRHEEKSAPKPDIEERLRKIEEATSSLIAEVTAIREKERFMARLQASAVSRETQQARQEMAEGDLSPLRTQAIPVIPRISR